MLRPTSKLALAFVALSACDPMPAPTDPAPPAATVRVRLDDRALPDISLAVGAPAVELSDRLPPGVTLEQVRHVYAEADGGRHMGLRNPDQRYDHPELRLSLDPAGRPTLGVYRTIPEGASPAVQASRDRPVIDLVGVHTVTLSVASPARDGDAPIREPLIIQVNGRGGRPIPMATLATLPEATDPRGKAGGWLLTDLLKARLGDTPIESIEVVARDPNTEPIALPHPDEADALVIVKHNRSGALRIQRWSRRGDASRPAAVYKDVTGLRVTAREAAP